MTDATEEFFERVARRRREPLARMVSGTARIELRDGDRTDTWLFALDRGLITVSREDREADCLVRADRAVFNRIASGELNPLTAVFRGDIDVEGNGQLLVVLQRLFPSPPLARGLPPPAPSRTEAHAEQVAMTEGMVRILEGATFVVSDRRGDIDATPADPSGLFSFDTRYLSKWRLTINGERLSPLSIDDLHYFEARFFLVPGLGTVYVDVKLSVLRQRTVCDGFCDLVTILNHDEEPADLVIRVEANSDFAHIFEVKNASPKRGKRYARCENGRLILGYERERFRRETRIWASVPADVDEHGLTMNVRIEPQGRWSAKLYVEPGTRVPAELQSLAVYRPERPDQEEELRKWLAEAPRLETDWDPLNDTYRRSLIDLAALRFRPVISGYFMPAAGLPWFMTMFGRDSILTSLQTLPFVPDLAAATLRLMAVWQGTRTDDFRDEDPGRIMHELRYGELTAFEEEPHSPYYGTADATPLFVVLLDEYERWTGDDSLVRAFEFEARAALNWIDQHGDLMGNGYISYQRRNEVSGLENQCWKDSWDSISYHDGRFPGFPRATCELQGYAYDAKMRAARMARTFWNDPAFADRLEREAADLKQRFNRDFWIPDRQFFALALDADGSQVDALSSNIGHLLWSGIVDRTKAQPVVEHLMGPKLFSGWGVRTLAEGAARYNPIGYHVGTVWPFDNSFIAWGLRRYGYREEAARIAAGIFDAANFFDGRLPEAFGGYDRAETRYPVRYPTACSPQAWSSGAPMLFLRTMLGLEPSGQDLVINPALPVNIGHIKLLDIRGRWGRLDAFARGPVEPDRHQGLRPQLGIHVRPR